MAVSDLQLVVNTLLYFSIFVCGFVISIPLGVANVSKEKVLFTLKTRYVYARWTSWCINMNSSIKKFISS